MRLTVELSDECPLNCSHCSSVGLRGRLTLADIEKVLRVIDPREIVLSGGEPFMHPQFRIIAERLLDAGYLVSLNTCGLSNKTQRIPVFFDPSYSIYHEELPYDLVSRFTTISVSIYGQKEVHDAITQSFSFEASLNFYLMTRTFLNTKKGKVLVNSPVFSEDQVHSMLTLFTDKGQLSVLIHFTRLLPHGRAVTFPVLKREDQLQIAIGAQAKFPDVISISESLIHHQCNWQEKRTLLPNGRLINCVAGKYVSDTNRPFVCDLVAT